MKHYSAYLIILLAFVLAQADSHPSPEEAFSAYAENHTSVRLFDAITALENLAASEGDSVAAIQPICYAHIGTFPVGITRGKGYLSTAGITYSGWVVQLRVTFVLTSNLATLSPALSNAIVTGNAYRVGRFWKVNGEDREYAPEGESTFFFQKYVMVYYLQSVDGYEFWDADFLTRGAISK